jgi:hypothetical protein
MANSGPNTNKSQVMGQAMRSAAEQGIADVGGGAVQFFITFRSCQHLDRKHTVFGKLVGGLDTLSDMERVKTDEKDRPMEVRALSRLARHLYIMFLSLFPICFRFDFVWGAFAEDGVACGAVSQEIRILSIDVFTDPFQVHADAQAAAADKVQAAEARAEALAEAPPLQVRRWGSGPPVRPAPERFQQWKVNLLVSGVRRHITAEWASTLRPARARQRRNALQRPRPPALPLLVLRLRKWPAAAPAVKLPRPSAPSSSSWRPSGPSRTISARRGEK